MSGYSTVAEITLGPNTDDVCEELSIRLGPEAKCLLVRRRWERVERINSYWGRWLLPETAIAVIETWKEAHSFENAVRHLASVSAVKIEGFSTPVLQRPLSGEETIYRLKFIIPGVVRIIRSLTQTFGFGASSTTDFDDWHCISVVQERLTHLLARAETPCQIGALLQKHCSGLLQLLQQLEELLNPVLLDDEGLESSVPVNLVAEVVKDAEYVSSALGDQSDVITSIRNIHQQLCQIYESLRRERNRSNNSAGRLLDSSSDTTGVQKPKRSHEDIRMLIVAQLYLHHRPDEQTVTDKPIGLRELARLTKVSVSTCSEHIAALFGSHNAYVNLCGRNFGGVRTRLSQERQEDVPRELRNRLDDRFSSD